MFIGFLVVAISLYTAMHAYVYRRIRLGLSPAPRNRRALKFLFALLVLTPFAGRFLDHNGHPALAKAVNLPTFLWMGWVFWFCTAGWCLDLWNLVCRPWRLAPRLHLAVCAAFVATATLWGFVEASTLSLHSLSFTIPGMSPRSPPVRIVHVSDVHLGTVRSARWNRKLVSRIAALRPDLVVMTGDFVDSSVRNIGNLAAEWDTLRPPLGKFAVLGNHEFYAGMDEAIRLHEAAGFQLLRAAGADAGGNLRLYGVDDVAGVLQGLPARTSEAGLPAGSAPHRFTILLKHQPRIHPLSRDRFDLQLSGHTHGAQMFPFQPFVGIFYPLLAGLYEVGERSRLYVSRGAGTWGPPLRVLAPPEITLITLAPPAGSP